MGFRLREAVLEISAPASATRPSQTAMETRSAMDGLTRQNYLMVDGHAEGLEFAKQ